MPARKILVVDDDDVLRDSLVEQLSLYEEFEIAQEATAAKGVQPRAPGHVDLVVMDVGLPDMDGREAVKLLRKGGFKAPVIMLTGQDSESDTILGLEAGANDYVTKPFRFAVLLARIRAQLRQHEQSEDAVFTIGPYTFRPSAKVLVDERGQKIRLTEKETSLFEQRFGNRGAVHRYEGRVPPVAVIVESLCHQFLACPAFAGNQDVCRAVGHSSDEIEDDLHRLALSQNLVEAVLLQHFPPKSLDLPTEAHLSNRARRDADQFVVLDRLDQVIVGALLHCFDRGLDGSERGHQNDVDVRISFLDR